MAADRVAPNPGSYSETSRQLVHMAMGGFALLLRWIPWWQAVALAVGAIVFNLAVLPRVGGRIYRPGDRERGVHGIVYYPLAVLLLLLAFPRRLDIVAAAWGILAIGDGIATLVGRAIGGPRWPWNRDKTVSGSAAFAIFGAAAGVGLAWWCRPAIVPPVSPLFSIVAPIVAAVAAALVETIPVRLDDNLSVAATAGTVLYLVSLASLGRVPAAGALAEARLPAALAVNLLVAWTGHRARTVSISGAVAGAVIGITIFVSVGWQGWTLLLITFIAASIASRLGLKRKVLLGIAEERGGRRGAGNAIANCSVAAIAAIVALSAPYTSAALLALAAALTAGCSDTVASEIGKAWGRSTFLVTTFSRVKPGTPGAMSLEGTAAGLLAAFALAAVAVAFGLIPASATLAVVAGAMAGALVESALAATLEGPGILNNDMLNFITTAIAAVVALAMS